MKKLGLVVAVLMVVAAPALATTTVNITCTADGNIVTVNYAVVSDPNKVRAFALDITVDNPAWINDVNNLDAKYWVYPGSIVILNGEVNDVGSPVASPTFPGTLGGLDTNGVTIEMGSLYYPTGDNSPNAPPLTGTLLKFKVCHVFNLCQVKIKENTARGGIVLTDPTKAPTVNILSPAYTFVLQAIVPPVVGLTEAAAITAITGVGLVAANGGNEYSNTIAAGFVSSQVPVGGTSVPPGSTVTYKMSLGKPVVPNVSDGTKTPTDANAAITAVDNLVVGARSYAWHATVVAGKVCAQNPVGGTPVLIGSTVTYTVSLGPQPVNCMPAAGTGYDTQRGQFDLYVASKWDPTQWCAYNLTTNPKGGYQCHGDADGAKTAAPNSYRIASGDLNLVVTNWSKKMGVYPLGADPRADIDHKATAAPNSYRVSSADLNRIVTNWSRKDTPCTACVPPTVCGLPRNCPLTDIANGTYVKPTSCP